MILYRNTRDNRSSIERLDPANNQIPPLTLSLRDKAATLIPMITANADSELREEDARWGQQYTGTGD
jgi:hypothetical protein